MTTKDEGGALVAEMEHGTLVRIHVPSDEKDMLDARTWTATTKAGRRVPLTSVVPASGDDAVYISVSQREDGRHRFVALSEALGGAHPLALLDEDDIKEGASASATPSRLVYARSPLPETPQEIAAAAATWDHPDLTPHRGWTNYSVLPWLCLGRTNAMMLSDEETLCRDQTDPIFRHLTLIVNCHQDAPARQYKAGAPWHGAAPSVVSHAVHKWFGYSPAGRDAICRKIDAINEAMWEAVQRGTVAVHCLAGIHRAACIMACHFLYRHHVLGHASVPSDTSDIYEKMISVRPNVSPAYAHILNGYQNYLKRKRDEKTSS